MNSYIQFKKANCKNCYKCIRHCPVKSIKFSDNQANIVHDECILCGMCFLACPQNAKQIRNDVAKVKELIGSGRPVYASLAPSFVANYDGVSIKAMEKALQGLGFFAAEETAVGAEIVNAQYTAIMNREDTRVLISSCCHTVNSLIQKYYPQALQYLAKVMSPMQAHCSRIKQLYPDACTVFIGPCISKKEEADQYPGIVDCVLTFEELTDWFKQENIALEKVSDEPETGGKSRLYPTAGGIIRSMDGKEQTVNYLVVDGVENCIHALRDLIENNLPDQKCFIEMSACSGSCIGGPAMDRNHRTPVRDYMAVNGYARRKNFGVSAEAERLVKEIKPIHLSAAMPSEKEIRDVLVKMGKTSPEQELNCGSCGYNSCREKAVAVCRGKADLTMCLPFLKEKAESFSDKVIGNTPNGIMVLNEELEVQLVNKSACRIMNIANPRDVIGSPVIRLLNPSDYVMAMDKPGSTHEAKNYFAEYGKYVEETIIYDRQYHIIISIMRDITEEENRRIKKETVSKDAVEITDKVIEKQMRIVQEIASLLGETTAETKIALTHLKESLKNE